MRFDYLDGLGCSPGTPGNPFTESDDESDTEDDTTVVSAVEKPSKPSPSISSNHISVSPTLSCAPSGTKRLKSEEVKLDKSNLSLPLRRQTGGCSSISRVNTAQSFPAPSPEVLPCPMCPFTDSDPGRLEEHVNREHLDKLSPAVQVDRTLQDITGQDRTGQDRTGQDRTQETGQAILIPLVHRI